MKLPIRTQPDTLTRLRSQRDALQKRLQDAEQKLERIDALDAGELIALEDDLSTTRRTLALVAERITAAEQEARQTATAEQEAQRLDALAAERKAYDSALGAVVQDVLRLDASLQALTAVRLRLGALGDFGAADATLHLAQAVGRVLLIWRITQPELLGLPAYNRAAELRADAIEDAAARLERAERRRDALKEFAKQGYEIYSKDWAACNDDVKSARRQLAIASGQPWTAQDEAQPAEGLIFTPRRTVAEMEELVSQQARREALAPPTPRRR